MYLGIYTSKMCFLSFASSYGIYLGVVCFLSTLFLSFGYLCGIHWGNYKTYTEMYNFPVYILNFGKYSICILLIGVNILRLSIFYWFFRKILVILFHGLLHCTFWSYDNSNVCSLECRFVDIIIRENNKTIEHQLPRKTADNSNSVLQN